MSGARSLDNGEIARLRQAMPGAFPGVSSRLASWTVFAAFAALTAYCLLRFEFSLQRFVDGSDQLGVVVRNMIPPHISEAPEEILWALAETVAMAFLGTLIGAIIAVPLAFMAARNTMPWWLPRFGTRRILDGFRGVDQMIWALIFVRAVGLGPLAGIMAIAISDIGTLAKLYSESIENVDRKQQEGMRAVGASGIETVRFGLVPQVLPMMLSSTLYMFESNTRSATILGVVGAGGIGFQLSDRIRAHQWEEAAFILILVLITVALIDTLSRWLRSRLIGPKT
jgi:phosphonate transport system permease protein